MPAAAATAVTTGESVPFPAPAGYETLLPDARAIALHVEDTSPHEVELESTEEAFFGCSATLRWLWMDAIAPQTGDGHRRIPSRERRYRRMDPTTCPPIVVEDGVIADGHHRHRVALALRLPGMWCYVVEAS